MPSAKKPVPEFRSEDEERAFWAEHDSTEYIDWHSANRRDVPYQSLLKVFLAERLEKERRKVG